MKNLIDKINESIIKEFELVIESSEDGDYFLLNKSGIKGNKKLEKLAKMAGYKVNGEYYFCSVRGTSREECEKVKNQAHIKDDPNFIIVHKNDFDNDSPCKE